MNVLMLYHKHILLKEDKTELEEEIHINKKVSRRRMCKTWESPEGQGLEVVVKVASRTEGDLHDWLTSRTACAEDLEDKHSKAPWPLEVASSQSFFCEEPQKKSTRSTWVHQRLNETGAGSVAHFKKKILHELN